MTEIEITTTGELLFKGDPVARIIWTRPFVESEVAGTYYNSDDIFRDFGDPFECSGCDDRDDEIEELEDQRDKLLKERNSLREKLEKFKNTSERQGGNQ